MPLLLAGVFCAALGLVDPRLQLLAAVGPVLGTAGLLAGGPRRASPVTWLLFLLAWTYAVAVWSRPGFGGDSPSYYVYLRSAFFDHDLEFANEWQRWGYREAPRTATGHQANAHAVGSAILWAPFYLAVHLYVLAHRALGRLSYAADGFSEPYIRSLALGTATLVVCGASALAASLGRWFGGRAAALGVAGAALASPIPYYVFVQPAMAHGLVFALACAFVALLLMTEDAESTRTPWIVLGALLGLLALTRWQASVYAFMFLPLLARGIRTRRLHWSWVLLAAGAALLVFLPQLVVWKVLFGSALAAPSRQHGMDWTSPHLLDVLISADRGFFSWTPVMILGLFGLLWLAPRRPAFVIAALAVFASSVWINGGVKDWAGADAYGGRRFDLVVPLFAVGIAAAADAMTGLVARRPWLPVAVALLFAAAWNVGLMRLYRIRVISEAAPLESVAARQVHQLRRFSEAALLRLGGPRLRNVAYNFFVGEYLYWNVNLDGRIEVGAVEGRFLGDGWSPAHRRAGWPPFRWALYPRACVAVPLLRPNLLRSTLRARAPEGAPGQSFTVVVNGRPIASRTLPADWADIPFEIPESALTAGPNSMCFEFSGSVSGEEGPRAAAAVEWIQLP